MIGGSEARCLKVVGVTKHCCLVGLGGWEAGIDKSPKFVAHSEGLPQAQPYTCNQVLSFDLLQCTAMLSALA